MVEHQGCVPAVKYLLDMASCAGCQLPGHAAPVALVCTGEKGNVTFRLTVTTKPGHASNPPKEGCVGILARAVSYPVMHSLRFSRHLSACLVSGSQVSRLEQRPMPCHFSSAGTLLGCLAGGFSGPYQVLMSNLWLFGPLLTWVFSLKPVTASMVRTTTALTVFNSGNKSNVLPG